MVWIADLLPDESAGPIADMMEQGMATMKQTLASGQNSPCSSWPRHGRSFANCGRLGASQRTGEKSQQRTLAQVEVLMAQGKAVAGAVRSIGVTEVTYYRWRREYGGLKGDQVKRLKGVSIGTQL